MSDATRPPAVQSEPFTRASLYLGPLFEAHGFRCVAREYAEGEEGSASAEYRHGALALRLVWEGEERALWIEAARAADGAIISRWQDIEWLVAGDRLPLDTALDDARLARLAAAVVGYLEVAGRG
ncbi:MAG: hypothetical protein U0974_06200 [Gemmatimonadales bacterium]|nr:hypothetical protein [Gemmatimonadales bacterium]MDZ4389303.1 hypothetical protein [Gemmatimonadales bacterium]